MKITRRDEPNGNPKKRDAILSVPSFLESFLLRLKMEKANCFFFHVGHDHGKLLARMREEEDRNGLAACI